MKKSTIEEGKACPRCGSIEKQSKYGFTVAQSQRYSCGKCNYKYTLDPKPRIYSDEVQALAMRAYYSGISGRAVGKMFGMNKANIYRWIKKTGRGVDKSDD
jgi:transposase-like protein